MCYLAEMPSNLDRYKKDLDALVVRGGNLIEYMQLECFPEQYKSLLTENLLSKGTPKKDLANEVKKILTAVPSLRVAYQPWYSEAKAVVKQLLPDRLSDFVRLYEKGKPRKAITFENYTIEDYLQGLTVTQGGWEKTKVVGPDAAIPRLQQQVAILESVKARFESSLFDIRQLVQADLFDSELDIAEELARNKFTRAAGAVAGVVLERHLSQVCDNHTIKVGKKAPGLSDLNNVLKLENVVDVPEWRFIQHLADIRNLCDHNKAAEPTVEQVNDLIAGVRKLTKTLF